MINTANSLEIQSNKSITYGVVIVFHLLVIFYRSASEQRVDFAISLKKQAVSSLAVRLASKKVEIEKPKKIKKKIIKKIAKASKVPLQKPKTLKKIKETKEQVATKQEVTRNFKKSIQNYTKPSYPRIARLRRMQGRVLLKIQVSHLGLPLNVQILKSTGYKLLDKTALKAVQKWRFLPLNNITTQNYYWVEKSIEFKMK